jgi:hypothetical protein
VVTEAEGRLKCGGREFKLLNCFSFYFNFRFSALPQSSAHYGCTSKIRSRRSSGLVVARTLIQFLSEMFLNSEVNVLGSL